MIMRKFFDKFKEINIDKNLFAYLFGLFSLFYGLILQYGWAFALIVIGSILICVSIATSFFVTWLSSKAIKK